MKSVSWEENNNQAMKDNITTLVHNIATPLTVITGNAELLEEDIVNLQRDVCDKVFNLQELQKCNIDSEESKVEIEKQLVGMYKDMDELCKGILKGCERIKEYMELLVEQNTKMLG